MARDPLSRSEPDCPVRAPDRLWVRVGDCQTVAERDRPITVGRAAESDLRIDNTLVSRRHLAVRFEAGEWVVEDVGSRNGTYHDGTPVRRVVIGRPTHLTLGGATTGVTVDVLLEEPSANGNRAPVASVPAIPNEQGTPDLGDLSISHRLTRPVRIGRAPENDIVLSDLSVSRQHAMVHGDPTLGWAIVDLGSHNGTYVNGQRVTQAQLSLGDIVVVGKVVLQLTPEGLAEYTNSGEVAFEAHELRVRTPAGTVLLDGVSFNVEPRGLVAVVGTSGAGKSTLLNALAGFRPADEGAVLFGGRDLYEHYDEIRQQIGYVPQQDILHTQLTVRRALQYGAELRFPPDVAASERERRVDEVMAELGLTERADLRIGMLSGGQRKRTSIALELLTKPALLFLDEPTSGLDPGMEKSLMALLRRLADGGRTVIVVTHSVQSLDLCDRLLFLAPGGRTAYFGPPKAALEFFEHEEFADVFAELERKRDGGWKERFEASPACREFVRLPHGRAAAVAGRGPGPPTAPPPRHRWGRQVSTLTRRYLSVIVSDRVNLALLMLQAPILGAIILAAVNHGGFAGEGDPQEALAHAQQAGLFLVVSATYLGAGNAIREIVKELPIYQRERSVGLSISAYLVSKVAVLSVVTALQMLVLVGLGAAGQGQPSTASTLGWPWLEVYVAIALSGLAAMTMGLLVSASVKNADKALTLLPLLLVPQLVLASPQLHIDQKPVLAQAAYLASAQWGFAAIASTVDSNGQTRKAATEVPQPPPPPQGQPARSPQPRRGPAPDVRPEWDHDASAWSTDVLILVALCTVEVLGAAYLLHRRDPSALGPSMRRGVSAGGARIDRRATRVGDLVR